MKLNQRLHFVGTKYLLWLPAALLSLNVTTTLADPFTQCPSKAFLFQGNPVSSYGINLVTGNYSLIEDDVGVSANINGVGFNEQDRYIYGFNTTHFQLTRLGSDFQAQNLNLSGLPQNKTFYVGDVANHTYYLYRKNTGFYKVDLSPLDQDDSAPLTAQLITSSATINLTDFAFHPNDGKLYGVDNNSGDLYQINPETGSHFTIGNTGETGTFGAMYFDKNGYFYLSRNQDGKIYRIDLSSLTLATTQQQLGELDVSAIKFADGPNSNQNDGARCASAPLIDEDIPSTIDFGDAPSTYGTLLSDNGARHQLDNVTYLGLAPPDGDYDGYQGADSDDTTIANGESYDDEDGVNFVTALEGGLDSVISVYASSAGTLSAWFDWNRDGDFSDEGEQSIIDITLNAGANMLAIRVPIDADVGSSWSRFRFSQQSNLDYFGGSTSGEVEDHPIQISSANLSYRYYPSESGWVTLAYEDQWPESEDYDMNDVVMRYRTTEVIRDNEVIRVDISGELQAIGGYHHNGFAVQLLDIETDNINQQTLRLLHNNVAQEYSGTHGGDTWPILEAEQPNAVVAISQDLWKQVNSSCVFYRTEIGCDQAQQFDFEISIPFITPVSLAEMPSAPYDPFIFATENLYHGETFQNHPGRSLEIHLADHAPTARFNSDFFGLQDDTSDPTLNRYFRTSNNLPWAMEIPGQWSWPSERKSILQAYPRFQQFVESQGAQDNGWYEADQADSNHLFE